MGSWYQTCAVTKTAIQPGQPCRLIFIGGNERISESVTSVSGMYGVIDTFIPGIYSDDHGFPHVVDEKALAHFHRVTQKLGFPVFGEDEVFKYEQLMGDGFLYRDRAINFCIVSETVFEHLASEIDALKFEFLQCAWPKFLTAIEQGEYDFKSSGAIIKASAREVFDNKFKRDREIDCSRNLFRFLNFGWGAGSSVHFFTNIFPDESEGMLERIYEFIEVWVISDFLDLTRGMWCPQGGQGSQEINSKKQYNKLISMISDRIADDVNDA